MIMRSDSVPRESPPLWWLRSARSAGCFRSSSENRIGRIANRRLGSKLMPSSNVERFPGPSHR